MKKLIYSTKEVIKVTKSLPFSLHSCLNKQHEINCLSVKPRLVCILDESNQSEIKWPAGNFIFSSSNSNINLNNLLKGTNFFALVIEFETEDFENFTPTKKEAEPYFLGPIDSNLKHLLQYFVECSTFATSKILHIRRQEILQYLYHLGYKQIGNATQAKRFSEILYNLMSSDVTSDWNANIISATLAISKSTLRRKLEAENLSLQEVKDRVKLGYGLYLVETTQTAMSQIAQQCGYRSPSRFTEAFKKRYGITPSKLRKIRMNQSGEILNR